MEQIKPTQPVLEPVRPAEPQVPVGSPVVKKLPVAQNTKMMMGVVALLVIGLGVATGWFMSGTSAMSTSSNPAPTSNVAEVSETGVNVSETIFSDSAEGVLKEGGTEGEGTHHLEREGQDTVYLLSTVLDLDSFISKKVQVQGQSLAAEHAGWLMDVGKVKVLQ
jgi:hypothetical protein